MATPSILGTQTNFGYIRDGKVYRAPFRTYQELEIGVVKDSDEAALDYFSRRFTQLAAKVEALAADMAASDNKGSYLNKILYLREHLPEANAIGDYEPLLQKLEELEGQLRSTISDNRRRNLEVKRSMVEKMEGLKDATDFKALSETLRELRLGWIKTGPVPPEEGDALEARYEAINQHFFEQRRAYIELRSAQIADRTVLYDSIIERTKELANPDLHPGQVIKTVNALSQEWKEVGNIPKEQYEAKREDFRTIKKELIRKAKGAFRKKPDGKPRPLTPEEIEHLNNYKKKQAILAEAQALLEKGDFRGAYPKVKEMQAAWHAIGMIPKQKAFINKDFVYVCDRISEFSFLNKMLYQANPYYFRLVPKDLAQAKINIMKDIIRKEEADIEMFSKQIQDQERAGATIASPDFKALTGRVHSQSRRLNVKKEILNELKEEALKG